MKEFGIINTNIWQESIVKPEVKTFINTEHPQIIHIIKSGWAVPQMYEVIIEDGEIGGPDLLFLTSEQITNKFNIKL
jgi:hypothetical protein